jgi:hypothetical protein
MGAPEKILIIAAAEWGEVIAAQLAPCFTVPGALALVADQVQAGIAQVFTVDDGGGIVGAFVLRVEGSEGVIVAAAGHLEGVELLPLLLPQIEARFVGCSAVRVHTARPGLAKVMAGFGYQGQEIVLRKGL